MTLFKIPKTIVKGNIKVQGTYINFKDAQQLYEHFDLRLDPLKELVGQMTPVPAIRPVVNTTPRNLSLLAATPVSTIVDGTSTILYDRATFYLAGDGSFRSRNHETLSVAFPTVVESREVVADAEHYSQYTESNYEHRSYLAPANRSYLELCTTDNKAKKAII